jgi:hypothetical protein
LACEGAARRNSEAPGLDQHDGTHRAGPHPTRCGALHGQSGLFAGRWAKLEPAGALGSANGIASHLERIGAAEVKAARTYRASVAAQCEADATPIPKLSARAEAAVTALAVAPAEHVRAELWRGLTTDKVLGPEIERFSAAVRQRFGEGTVRAMLRSRGDLVGAASVPRAHQDAIATVSRTVHTLRQGERANDAERLTQRQTLGSRARMRP